MSANVQEVTDATFSEVMNRTLQVPAVLVIWSSAHAQTIGLAERVAGIAAGLDALPGAQVHAVTEGGKLVVTLEADTADEMLGQMFAKPKALIVAAAFLMLLAMTGLPKPPLMILGFGMGTIMPAARPASA